MNVANLQNSRAKKELISKRRINYNTVQRMKMKKKLPYSFKNRFAKVLSKSTEKSQNKLRQYCLNRIFFECLPPGFHIRYVT